MCKLGGNIGSLEVTSDHLPVCSTYICMPFSSYIYSRSNHALFMGNESSSNMRFLDFMFFEESYVIKNSRTNEKLTLIPRDKTVLDIRCDSLNLSVLYLSQ